jgi:hypothetical protein
MNNTNDTLVIIPINDEEVNGDSENNDKICYKCNICIGCLLFAVIMFVIVQMTFFSYN